MNASNILMDKKNLVQEGEGNPSGKSRGSKLKPTNLYRRINLPVNWHRMDIAE